MESVLPVGAPQGDLFWRVRATSRMHDLIDRFFHDQRDKVSLSGSSLTGSGSADSLRAGHSLGSFCPRPPGPQMYSHTVQSS